MEGKDHKAIDRRLARAEGQVRGVRRLLEEDAYCCDVLNQIAAARSALDQAAAMLASQHIRHCVLGHNSESAHPHTQAMSQEDVLDELEEVLRRLVR